MRIIADCAHASCSLFERRIEASFSISYLQYGSTGTLIWRQNSMYCKSLKTVTNSSPQDRGPYIPIKGFRMLRNKKLYLFLITKLLYRKIPVASCLLRLVTTVYHSLRSWWPRRSRLVGDTRCCKSGISTVFTNKFFYLLLFASCTDTFSKWCKVTRGMKRSAQ
jgi:hypothetical protein